MSGAQNSLHVSPPRPCPYLPGRTECVVAAELSGPGAAALYDGGIRAGFRRSHNFMYRPACPGCDACRPVRVIARAFEGSRSLARVRRLNRGIVAEIVAPRATTEQYGLFARYQAQRHPGGGMDGMSFIEYRAMVEESPVATFVAEFRVPGGALVALMLADETGDGLSAVYSFFDPSLAKLALGNYMILWLIDECRRRGLDYVYLGYWIAGCEKMDYKARFRPVEALGRGGWAPLRDGRRAPVAEAPHRR